MLHRKTQQTINEFMWTRLRHELDDLRRAGAQTLARSERAETAGGVDNSTFANRPLTNNRGGDMLWISNGRKVGEGVGAGTGVLCYYNPGTATWKRISDDSDVAI